MAWSWGKQNPLIKWTNFLITTHSYMIGSTCRNWIKGRSIHSWQHLIKMCLPLILRFVIKIIVSSIYGYSLFLIKKNWFTSAVLTGKVCCNFSVLASWKWVSRFMEQYADYRRLLFLLVPGKLSLSFLNCS